MKKLLILSLVLLAAQSFAAELTADSPAVAVSFWEKILGLVLSVISMALGALALEARAFIKDQLRPTLAGWLKGVMHFRGSDVIADGLAEEISSLSNDILTRLNDRKITPAEWDEVKANAAKRIKPRLLNLAGFYKKDLDAWIDEQLGVQLGKLLYRNSSGSGSKTP